MSYVTQADNSRRRSTAIAAVIGIHATIGYVLVTGLSYVGMEKVKDEFVGIFIPEPPKTPPPEPVVEPEPAKAAPMVAPKPPLDIPSTARVDVVEFDPLVIPDPIVVPIPTPSPLIQPKPQPSFAPRAARPRNDPARWVMTEDYPAGSIRLGEEGTTGFAVIVGSDGRVDNCEITRSSGSARLDEATCRYVEKRARFEAATDGNGTKVVSRYTSTVRWQIPR